MADDNSHENLRGKALMVIAEGIRAAHEKGDCPSCFAMAMAEAATAMVLAKYLLKKKQGDPKANDLISAALANIVAEGLQGGAMFADKLSEKAAKESAEDFMSGIMAAASGRPN